VLFCSGYQYYNIQESLLVDFKPRRQIGPASYKKYTSNLKYYLKLPLFVGCLPNPFALYLLPTYYLTISSNIRIEAVGKEANAL